MNQEVKSEPVVVKYESLLHSCLDVKIEEDTCTDDPPEGDIKEEDEEDCTYVENKALKYGEDNGSRFIPPFEFIICDYTTTRPYYVNDGEWLQCALCGFECKRKNSLKGHISEKHNTDKAGDNRTVAFSSARHVKKARSVVKHFKCDLCRYACAKRSQLRRHTFTHTGERPFACLVCAYRCTQRGHLKEHMASHTGDMPFACVICDYRGKSQRNLNWHKLTHTSGDAFR